MGMLSPDESVIGGDDVHSRSAGESSVHGTVTTVANGFAICHVLVWLIFHDELIRWDLFAHRFDGKSSLPVVSSSSRSHSPVNRIGTTSYLLSSQYPKMCDTQSGFFGRASQTDVDRTIRETQ